MSQLILEVQDYKEDDFQVVFMSDFSPIDEDQFNIRLDVRTEEGVSLLTDVSDLRINKSEAIALMNYIKGIVESTTEPTQDVLQKEKWLNLRLKLQESVNKNDLSEFEPNSAEYHWIASAKATYNRILEMIDKI